MLWVGLLRKKQWNISARLLPNPGRFVKIDKSISDILYKMTNRIPLTKPPPLCYNKGTKKKGIDKNGKQESIC